jgi:hypothetical protein
MYMAGELFPCLEKQPWDRLVDEFMQAVPSSCVAFQKSFFLEPTYSYRQGRYSFAMKSDWSQILAGAFKTDPRKITQDIVAHWQSQNTCATKGNATPLISSVGSNSAELYVELTAAGKKMLLEEGACIRRSFQDQHIIVAPFGIQFGSLERLRFLAHAWMQYRLGIALGRTMKIADWRGDAVTMRMLGDQSASVTGGLGAGQCSALQLQIENCINSNQSVVLWCTQRSFSNSEYRDLCGLARTSTLFTLICSDAANSTREAKVMGAAPEVTVEADWFAGAHLLYLLGEAVLDTFDPEVIQLSESGNLAWAFQSLIDRIDSLASVYGGCDFEPVQYDARWLTDSMDSTNSRSLTLESTSKLAFMLACRGSVLESAVSHGKISEWIDYVTVISQLAQRLCNDPDERRTMLELQSAWPHWQLLIETRRLLEFLLQAVVFADNF